MMYVLRPGTLAILSVLAAATVLIVPTGPASAGNGSTAQLIDKQFEECLIKHFQTRFFNRIDASPDQRQKLSAIIARRCQETRPLRERLAQGCLELNEMLAGEDASEEQLTAKAHEVRDLRNQVMDERLKSMLEARAVLTPGQRKQIAQRVSGLITGDWKHRFAGTP